ncbi:hypothetical protein BH09VER1_BH09VER1_05290 [soil metagenome]
MPEHRKVIGQARRPRECPGRNPILLKMETGLFIRTLLLLVVISILTVSQIRAQVGGPDQLKKLTSVFDPLDRIGDFSLEERPEAAMMIGTEYVSSIAKSEIQQIKGTPVADLSREQGRHLHSVASIVLRATLAVATIRREYKPAVSRKLERQLDAIEKSGLALGPSVKEGSMGNTEIVAVLSELSKR